MEDILLQVAVCLFASVSQWLLQPPLTDILVRMPLEVKCLPLRKIWTFCNIHMEYNLEETLKLFYKIFIRFKHSAPF